MSRRHSRNSSKQHVQVAEARSELSKLFWLVAAIIIVIVFGYGAHLSYGETFEDHIKIPIPDNSTGIEKKARLTIMTDELLEFTVTYRFYFDGNATKYFDDIFAEDGFKPPDVTVCPERFYLDEDGVTCYPISAKPPESNFVPQEMPRYFDDYEEAKEYFEENDPKTYQELVYSEKLQVLDLCQRGTTEARGIQDVDSYIIANYNVTETTPKGHKVLINTPEGELDLAIEECLAQRFILEPETLGEYTKSRGEFFGLDQPRHQDKAVIDEDDWPMIFTHENYVSPNQFETARDIICNSDRVVNSFKRLQDPPCSDEQMGISHDQTGYDIGNGKKINGELFDNKNIVDWSPLYLKDEYRLDKGEAQRKMLEQALRDEMSKKQQQKIAAIDKVRAPNEGWSQCPYDEVDEFGNPICIDVHLECTYIDMKRECVKVYGD